MGLSVVDLSFLGVYIYGAFFAFYWFFRFDWQMKEAKRAGDAERVRQVKTGKFTTAFCGVMMIMYFLRVQIPIVADVFK